MKLTEEKDGEFFINTPNCTKCENNRPMTGFFYKFYKNPAFSDTEVMSAFTWTEVYFICPRCNSKRYFEKDDLQNMNKYPLDSINFPPGANSKNARLQRLSNR